MHGNTYLLPSAALCNEWSVACNAEALLSVQYGQIFLLALCNYLLPCIVYVPGQDYLTYVPVGVPQRRERKGLNLKYIHVHCNYGSGM